MTEVKPLYWIGSSKQNLKSLPNEVQYLFGYALYLAQVGKKHVDAKPLQGFGSAGVLEVVEDWRGGTYRAVYTVRFRAAVFVLHVFKKKSKVGGKTPKQDLEPFANHIKVAEAKANELGP
jgi:phage-related protein